MLDWSEKKFPDFFRALHYALVESSPALRQRIEAILSRQFERGRHNSFVRLFDDHDGPTIVFANEFFDALPVEIVSTTRRAALDARDGRFVETWAPPSPEELEFLDRYSIHPEPGERIEVPLQSQIYISAAAKLKHGFVVVIDYGYTREEQLPDAIAER